MVSLILLNTLRDKDATFGANLLPFDTQNACFKWLRFGKLILEKVPKMTPGMWSQTLSIIDSQN